MTVQRSMGAMRAEIADCLEELGPVGLMRLAVSVAREKSQEAKNKDDKALWLGRAQWIESRLP